jgi:hypothetical protein
MQLFEFKGQLPMFISTKPTSSGENRKAYYKNYNLPILQHMYMGDSKQPLHCVINQTPAFTEFPCVVQKKPLMRFRIEFNHIRQRAAEGRQAGSSIDKNCSYGPSELFRSRALDDPKYRGDLIEFMTMMPVDADAHKWITQSSAYGDITLTDFPHRHWPWHLKTAENFSEICTSYGLEFLNYDQFIDHLSGVHHRPIQERCVTELDNCWQTQWLWR